MTNGPLCQAEISSTESVRYRQRNGTNDLQCNNIAKFRLHGKLYCAKHVGPVAVQELIKQGVIEKTRYSSSSATYVQGLEQQVEELKARLAEIQSDQAIRSEPEAGTP